MSAAKHTPGPWEFLENGRTEEEFNRGRALTVGGPRPNNDDLAQVFSRDDATVSIPREEAAANARLIAAAPDLLKLLREVLEWNEDDADLAVNDTAFRLKNFADTVSNRSAALKAAIAKATGAA